MTPPRVVSISKANHMAATGRKSTDSVALGRSRYRHCLLISALPLKPADKKPGVSVDMLRCKTLYIEQRPASVLCHYHYQFTVGLGRRSSWLPAVLLTLLPVISLIDSPFDPPIYLSIPSAIGTLLLAN